MSSTKKEQQQLIYEYEKSNNYIETYATGFWGGLNSSNKMQISFFEDQISIPDSTTILVEKGEGNTAKVLKDTPTPPEPKRVRKVKCSITFDVAKLDIFAKWIEDRKKEIAKLDKQV